MKQLLVLILLFVSCSPQKRISRILKKHPELISVIDVDTIFHDTIIELDTFITQEYRDSFIISSDTVIETRRVVIERIKDKFNVIIKTDTFIGLDTIFYTNTIKVKGNIVEVKIIPNWIYFVIGLCLILLIALWKK